MNVKQISIIITIVLLIVLSGVVIFTMTGSDTEPEDDGPQPFDTSETILSNTPPGIIEQDNQNIEINETELVNTHSNMIETNSATINIQENDVSYNIHKSTNEVYLERNNFEDITQQYSNEEYTITNNNNQYTSSNQSIDSNQYTKESNLKTLIKYLDVDTFSERNNGDIELILSNNNESQTPLSTSYGFDSINYASVNLIITTDGLIKEADIELIGNENGVRDVVEKQYEVSDLDSTEFSSPNWLSDAENTISIVDGLYNRLDGQILIQHNGLSTIPEGHEIIIVNEDTGDISSTHLPEEFSEGDSLGFGLNSQGEWEVTVNEVPEEGNSIDSNRFRIMAENNNQEYFNILLRS